MTLIVQYEGATRKQRYGVAILIGGMGKSMAGLQTIPVNSIMHALSVVALLMNSLVAPPVRIIVRASYQHYYFHHVRAATYCACAWPNPTP